MGKVVAIFLVLLTAFVSGCSSEEGRGVDDLVARLQQNPDWVMTGKPLFYGPDNLFQLIDGAAPQFISAGFVRCARTEWRLRKPGEADDEGTIVADLYDMGGAEGAFGIYFQQRHEKDRREIIGEEASVATGFLIFWKGRFYVEVRLETEADISVHQQRMLDFARAVADRIESSTSAKRR